MSEFTVSIIIIGLPGIIIYFFSKKLIGITKHSNIEIVFLVFLYSILSYALIGFIEGLINLIFNGKFLSETASIIFSNKPKIDIIIILKGVFSSVILSYLLSYGARYNFINIIGQKINATLRYGDQDVWHYFHNAPEEQKNDGWLFVRDYKENLAYHCYISVWSDSGMDRELVISDVTVYTNDTAEYLYETDHLYLSRRREDISIEVPPKNAIELEEYSNKKGDADND